MNKTKIDWCDATWNPVTGCRHDCEYCYARRVAERFGKVIDEKMMNNGLRHCLGSKIKNNPYPFVFEPTLHEYRLNEPFQKTKPLTIFVCSMADLFGDWVPDDWINKVFDACKTAPQHRYLFLTKNPTRYIRLADADLLPEGDNYWYGTTVTKTHSVCFDGGCTYNTFVSIEPLLERLNVGIGAFGGIKWVIIGAETGSRADKITPSREWIGEILGAAKVGGRKIFMKHNLVSEGVLNEKELIQEFPWETWMNESRRNAPRRTESGRK